jgi:hypothetical protein
MTAAAGTKGTSCMSTAAGPPYEYIRKFSNSREDSISRESSNIQQPATTAGNHNYNISNSCRDNRNNTDDNNKRETSNITVGMPEIVQMPTTENREIFYLFFILFYRIIGSCSACNHLNARCRSPAVVYTEKEKNL